MKLIKFWNTVLPAFFLCFFHFVSGQTATIKVTHTNYDNQYEGFDKMTFLFNGQFLSAIDTIKKIIKISQSDFDSCAAIIGKDTLHFLTKFKNNENYTITPGCCCAVFILKAGNNAKRGSVRFANETNRDLSLIISEMNFDTVKSNLTSEYIFAHESAMCFFKPASIFIAETQYHDSKYDYTGEQGVNYDSLWTEQKKYILTKTWFHFLHGEKLTIFYENKTKTLKIKLDDYLSDEEYEKMR